MKFVKILAALTGFVAGVTATSAHSQVTVTKTGSAQSTGSTTTVSESDVIDWVITIENDGSDDLSTVNVTDTLENSQALIPGTFEFPSLFAIDQTALTSSSTSFSATSDSLQASNYSLVNALEKELEVSSLDLPTGNGDGWKVVFHPSTDRIFFTAHHWSTFSTNCFDLGSEESCAGYPKAFTVDGGKHVSTPGNGSNYEIFGNNYYFTGRAVGTNDYGVGCWNVVTENECGWTVMGDVSTGTAIPHDNPLFGFVKVSNTAWWTVDNRMKFHCFNPSTNAACTGANATFDISDDAGGPPINQAPNSSLRDTEFDLEWDGGNNVYLLLRYRDATYNADGLAGIYATCVNLSTHDVCDSWSTGPHYFLGDRNSYASSFLDRDAFGNPIGICASHALGPIQCTYVSGFGGTYRFRDTIQPGILDILRQSDRMSWSDEYYDADLNQTYAPMFWLNTNLTGTSGTACFDWSTRDLCANWGYDNDPNNLGGGGLAVQNNDVESRTADYAITVDPSTGCIYSLGHFNQVYTFDPEFGSSPCQTTRVKVIREASIINNYCSTGLSNFTGNWVEFTLDGLSLADFTLLEVRIFGNSAASNQLVYHSYTDAGSISAVDISSINSGTYKTLYYEITADLASGVANPFDDPVPYGSLEHTSNKPYEICFSSQPSDGNCGFRAPSVTNGVVFGADSLIPPLEFGSNSLAVEPEGGCAGPFNVGNRTFLDNDASGTDNAGDTDLGGVVITLYDNDDGNGTLDPDEWADTATSGSGGGYSINDVYAGEYCIMATTPEGLLHYEGAGSISNPYCFTFEGTADKNDLDFGYLSLVNVGDQVYIDNDRSGGFNTGDEPIAAASILLYTGSCPSDSDRFYATTTTDSNGNYFFNDVPTGDYCAEISTSYPGDAIEGDGGQEFTLVNSDYNDADFGFSPNGFIGDTVYIDNDANGGQNFGDVVVAGTTIELYTGTCPVDLTTLSSPYRTTTTGADGTYGFDYLPANIYCVVAVNPGLGDAIQGSSGHSVSVNTNTTLTADFGFKPVGGFGDLTYIDLEGDGSQIEVLGGVGITYYEGNCPISFDSIAVRSFNTASLTGFYTVDNVPNGDYCVVADVPEGFIQLTGMGGIDTTISGNYDDTVDFSFRPTGSIGDTIYTDNDQNFSFSAIDAPIPNMTVGLYSGLCPTDLSTLGTPLETTVSDSIGNYLFEYLLAGDYCVVANDTDSRIPLQGDGGQSVTVSGNAIVTADFGFAALGRIGDFTYVDADNSGDSTGDGDFGLGDVILSLYEGSCPSNLSLLPAVYDTIGSPPDGMYLFETIPDGDYCVVPSSVSGYTLNEGAGGLTATVTDGNAFLDADFGYVPATTIGDQLYIDNNKNGTFDTGDVPVASTRVSLYSGTCPADLGTLTGALAEMFTDANGMYLFEYLLEGNYCVTTDGSGLGNEYEGSGGQTVVASGSPVLTADFGWGPVGQIGFHTYLDTSLDGTFDGNLIDPPVPSVTVNLYTGTCPADLADLSDEPYETTISTSNTGWFRFNEVPDGDYCVVAENPGPYGQVEGIAGQDINVDSDVNTGNFGYYHSGSIGDQTYLDVDRDGLYLAENDEVLAGVIIDLYSGSCPADLATLGLPIGLTTTDANGNYLFEYIAAGDYCVLARDPGQGTQTQGTVGQSVTVTGGAVLTADFGYVPRGELGDQVYVDVDINNAYDGMDTPLSNVTLTLYEGLCPADLTTLSTSLDTMMSDTQGLYLFDGLVDGDYCVVASNAGAFDPLQGSAGQSATISTDTVLTADFGFSPAGAVGDQVYLDVDANGGFGIGDIGIENATVDLYEDACPADLADVAVRRDSLTTDANGWYQFEFVPDGTGLPHRSGPTRMLGLASVSSGVMPPFLYRAE